MAVVFSKPSAATTVTIESVTDLQGIEALEGAYEQVGRAAGTRLPFALHAWHATWCKHFLNCDPRIREQPLFYILRDRDRTCVAILPFIVSRRRFGVLSVVSIGMLGADPAITEIRTPMVAPGYEYLASTAVRGALAKLPDWDWIHWAGFGDEFGRALNAGAELVWQPPLSDFVLDLPPTWEELRSGLKRNIRESLRHCYNSLKRDGHRFTLEVIEDPGAMRAGLERFLELHRMRANLVNTVVHPDRFASRVSREFLHEVCERLAAQRRVRLFALKIGTQVVAMRIGFVVADALYLYYSGYDPAWARYGVMTTTVAEAIKYAIAHGLRTVNLSPTRDLSKTRWGPRQVDYGSAFETRERIRSRLASNAYLRARSEEGHPPTMLERFFARRSWR